MADGNFIVHGRVITGGEAAQMTLSNAVGAGHVVSRCSRCGHRESANVAYWKRSSFDCNLSLSTLSNRLRCLCGGRDLALEVWPVAPSLREEKHRTFHWRA